MHLILELLLMVVSMGTGNADWVILYKCNFYVERIWFRNTGCI